MGNLILENAGKPESYVTHLMKFLSFPEKENSEKIRAAALQITLTFCNSAEFLKYFGNEGGVESVVRLFQEFSDQKQNIFYLNSVNQFSSPWICLQIMEKIFSRQIILTEMSLQLIQYLLTVIAFGENSEKKWREISLKILFHISKENLRKNNFQVEVYRQVTILFLPQFTEFLPLTLDIIRRLSIDGKKKFIFLLGKKKKFRKFRQQNDRVENF